MPIQVCCAQDCTTYIYIQYVQYIQMHVVSFPIICHPHCILLDNIGLTKCPQFILHLASPTISEPFIIYNTFIPVEMPLCMIFCSNPEIGSQVLIFTDQTDEFIFILNDFQIVATDWSTVTVCLIPVLVHRVYSVTAASNLGPAFVTDMFLLSCEKINVAILFEIFQKYIFTVSCSTISANRSNCFFMS